MASASVAVCKRSFVQNSGEEIPIPAPNLILRSGYGAALTAAVQAAGLPTHAYELNGALRVVMERSDAEDIWLQGENVFEGVAIDHGANAEFYRSVDFLVSQVD